MDGHLILIILVAVYTAIAFVIHRNKLWEEHIVFYGPVMAIRTNRVGFFDKFTAFRTFFRHYGTVGVVAVIIVSVFITAMLIYSVYFTLMYPPEPTGIYKPQNLLLIPGLNEYIPSTFAVWFAFFITIAIHEFGHAILCRGENIKVKTMGALIAVIPIGFFVEPDEERLEQMKGMSKVRMFGAGITNNLVIGFACFMLLIFCMGFVTPLASPAIYGVYTDYPAAKAGVLPGSLVTAINGEPVTSRGDISIRLNATKPGDTLTLTIEKDAIVKDYPLTLASWPDEDVGSTSGFMGVQYYDGDAIKTAIEGMLSPFGFFKFLIIPFASDASIQYLRILAFDNAETSYYQVSFYGFWDLILSLIHI